MIQQHNHNQDLLCFVYKGEDAIANDESRTKEATHLVVDNHVKALPNRIFFDWPFLVSAVLPPGLEIIDDFAFYWCSSLKSISCPSSMTVIGKDAFAQCVALEEVNLEEGLEVIDEGAFYSCSSLKKISIPSTVLEVSNRAFARCFELAYVHFQDGLQILDDCSFRNCVALAQIWIPRTVHSIRERAFTGCRALVSVELTDGLTVICQGAFSGCKNLINVSLPSTVEEVAEDAFEGCSLLLERYPAEEIISNLRHRLDDKPLHRLCYQQVNCDFPYTLGDRLSKLLLKRDRVVSYVDEFGMTPFHMLAMSAKPYHMCLWQSLFQNCPNGLIRKKDRWGKCPMYYLLRRNTLPDPVLLSILPILLQFTVIGRIKKLSRKQWRTSLLQDVEECLESDVLLVNDRFTKLEQVYGKLAKYERKESIDVLELALWKYQIQTNGETSSSTAVGTGSRSHIEKNDEVSSRECCRISSGADIVIGNVLPFWGRWEDEEGFLG
eukprot:scaffold1136_cov146-Cylindrotheca_fusiformis.AAC.9